MAGINISLVSNVRDFIRGTKDASGALEDVVGSLEEVAREGDDLARKNDQNMREVAKDGEQASEKLERSFRDAFDTARKESRTSMDDVQRNTRRSMDDATDHVGAFKDEAKQNFAEMASSFDGSAEGIINSAQGLSGGLAASMGPAGVGIAVLGAGAGAFYQHWKQNSEKTKQEVSDMFDDMLASGADYLSQEMINQRAIDIVKGAEDAVVQMDTVRLVAEKSGKTQAQVIAAAAGDLDERAAIIATLQASIDSKVQAMAATTNETTKAGLLESLGTLEQVITEFEALDDKQSDAVDQLGLFRDALTVINQNANNDKLTPYFAGITREVEGTTAAINAIPSSKTVTVTVDTSAADAALKRLTSTQKVRLDAEYVTRDGKKVL